MEELYLKYAGKTAYDGRATICGYDYNMLIVALHETEFKGWTILSDTDIIVTCLDNEQGYKYALESDIDLLG